MKHKILVSLLAVSFSAIAQPSFKDMHTACLSAGRTMPTLASCLQEKLDTSYPGWMFKDEDVQQIKVYLDFVRQTGDRVKAGDISNQEGLNLARAKINGMATDKQAAKIWAARQRQIETDAQSSQLDEIKSMIEEQRKAARNQAIFDAGLQIMQNARRYNPPPQIRTCTYDTFQGMVILNCM